VDDDNLLVGQVDPGIVFGNASVVPGGDFAQVDVGQHVGAEFDVADAGDVEDGHNGAENGRQEGQLGLGLRQLLVGGGMSEAPKSTRPAVICFTPPPEPMDW